MKFVSFIVFIYLVGPSQVQTRKSNAASLKCPALKQIVRNNDGFAIQLNQPSIVYIYIAKSNSFIVLNTELSLFVILDGTNKTIFTCDANNGYGGVYNPKTDLVYVFAKNKNPFNISRVIEGDFSVAARLIDYASLYTDKVIGSNIDRTNSAYTNGTINLQDFATTTDFTKWVSYKPGHYINTAYYEFNMDVTIAANTLLNQYNNTYTVEWGTIIFFVIASEQYKQEEECLFAFIDVIVKLVRERDFGFSPKLMDMLYDIVFTQESMTKKKAIEKYETLLINM